jgi:hypothetical protein
MHPNNRLATDSTRTREAGMALITVILVTMLCAALMVGFTSAIVADRRASGLDRDQTQAYAVAHAGLEKLTSDLNALFRADFSPSTGQINALTTTSNRPNITSCTTPPCSGASFNFVAPGGGSGYTITWPYSDANGNPAPQSPTGSNINAGPYDGFMGIITPYELTVTARSSGGAEVRLRRKLQTVSIPVFQFGMFSETDLAFHAGETFNFGGRVHTNGNLFLAAANGATLTMGDRVTAVRDVIRTHLPNDLETTNAAGYSGTVLVPTTIRSPNNVTRSLARTEGSLTGTVGSSVNNAWEALSTGTYKSNIRNGRTGARRLDLPLVGDADGNGQPDAEPIELIRRPAVNSNEHVARAFLYQQRYYATASLRILLSDDINDIMQLPAVTATAPTPLTRQPLDLTGKAYAGLVASGSNTTAPLAESEGAAATTGIPANTYLSSAGQPLLSGYIKIEMQRQNNTWQDVTTELLALGITGRNLADADQAAATRLHNLPDSAADTCPEISPDAVIRLQRVRDVTHNNGNLRQSCGWNVNVNGNMEVSQNPNDYWPLVLYDAREATTRDGLATTDLALGGVIHYVELDVNNLRRWLLGQIGASGTQAKNDNGFIVYFSDRRNNNTNAGAETAEYGYEDTVNPALAAGAPNGQLDAGEDVNQNNAIDLYGGTAKAQNIPAGAAAPLVAGATPTAVFNAANKAGQARANKAILFRRALKLVNGGINNGVNSIIAPGLTIAAENPVYIQGNYNATSASTTVEPNVAAAVLADAVTTLSNSWNDIRSFIAPVDSTLRPASSTGYRLAIVTGKTRTFSKPNFASSSFGSDGGAHNFVRSLEDWSVNNVWHRYRGSFVSFYYSRQGTGSFKCCLSDVYLRGDRDWAFDTDFLLPTQLPPGTPMFRDVNTLTFRQFLRPNQ